MIVAQMEAPDELLRQRSSAALGEQRVACAQLHAALEIFRGLAVLADAHVARGDADDAAVLNQQLCGGKARIDLDAERFGLLPQPSTDIAE